MGVVIGICGAGAGDREYAMHARRAGLDPFGVQVISLGDSPVDGRRAARKLRVAAARATAFHGSRPANSKTVFAGMDGLVSRRALFTLPPVRYIATPTVDRFLCAAGDGCDFCIRACPHDALAVDGDNVVVDRERCNSCGICIAACPERAFEFPGNSAGEIEAATGAYLAGGNETDSPVIDFVCQNISGIGPGDNAGRVSVACAGMIPASALLGAVAGGAGAVSLRPCGDRCTNGGGDLAGQRVDYCRSLLNVVGDDPGRIVLNTDGSTTAPATTDASVERIARSRKESGQDAVPKLFGAESTARAVVAIADSTAIGPVALEHESSPLGLVSVDRDSCTACGTCVVACPAGALRAEESDGRWLLRFDPSLCVACDECTKVCPEIEQGAITMRRVTDLAALREGSRVLIESDMIRCRRCGEPIASERVLSRLASMLGDEVSTGWMRELCVDCRALSG
jgi:ferredoxin